MKRFLSIFLVLVVISLFSLQTTAQSLISVPYSMGFELEDSVELANWVLNPGVNASKCVDQWYIGEAVKSEGRQSLYISSDEGASAMFGVAQNVQYVYRDFQLPKGQYEVSFDWACLGTNEAFMYAGVAPASNLTLQASHLNDVVPNGVLSWCKTLDKMYGTTLWKNASMKVNSNGTSTYRLFFVWTSSNRDTTVAIPLGACIDNIQICSANCAKPSKIEVESTCDSLWVSWKGTSEKYSLEYRRRGKKWSVPTVYYSESCVLAGLEEGLYDFRVRGICNDVDTSSYAYLNSVPLFCPDNHCLNYVALDDSVNVICSYGTFKDPESNVGVQDFGYENKYSRHTVNWEPDVYDPRTCNQLPTIPDGELASVRLGNWNNGGEAESISYTYVADIENAAIMLLKYAIVLEDPGHGERDNPQFTLEVYGDDGDLLSPTCGTANFSADANRQGDGWHTCSKSPGSTAVVSWKEWTTIGLNLAELGVKTGDVLTIKLTTKDCNWSAHYGYAYFTLGCAAAKIYGTSCGNDAVLSVSAPEGFAYEWYNKYDSLVATTKELSVEPSDTTTTYRCRLIFLGNEECDFNLYTSVRPRFPVAEFDYSYEPSDCQNRVVFTNRSHIMTFFNGDTVHNYNELCEDYEWQFGTGEESAIKDPFYIFPSEGGTFPVTLISSISEGSCVDDTTIYVTVPAIRDYEQVIDSTICQGSYVVFGKYYAAEERLYYDSLKTVAGCDSVIILDLKVNPVSKTVLPDTTICAEVPLCIDGDCYKHKTSGDFVRFFTNQYGCDSTVWMYVNVLDSILPVVELQSPTDDGELGSVTVSGTGYDYYYFNGVKYDASSTYHGDLEGGIMAFEFFNDFGCSVEVVDTMNSECVAVTLKELLPVCMGSSFFELPYVVDSGFPTTYSLLFDSIAQSVGFVDLKKQPVDRSVDELLISIPQTVIPGQYNAQLVFHNLLKKCEDPTFDLRLVVNFASDMIFQRWNDVLSVVSSAQNYGFQFEHFQWVKNGEQIPGANKSYYYEADGLDLDAEYQVEVLLPNGVRLTTCPFVPAPYETPQAQIQKVVENQQLIIIRNGVRYNAQGMMIQTEK